MKTLLLAFLLLMPVGAHAQEGWRERDGSAQPDTDSSKSVKGFGGVVLVTPDADWQKKWDTPAETTPNFSEAKKATRGQHLFMLIFFANPQTDDGGVVNVTCDIDVLKPDGTSQLHQTDVVCMRGAMQGDRRNTRLAAPVIEFVGEPGDPSGEWTVRVTLKDNQRHVTIPLKTSFVLQ